MAFFNANHMATTRKHDSKTMLEFLILLSMMTDTKSLFDTITKTSNTTKKRLMIGLKSVNGVYASLEVNDVALERSKFNIADAVTKVKTKCILFDTISNWRLDHLNKEWIICTKMNKVSSGKEKGLSGWMGYLSQMKLWFYLSFRNSYN